MALQGYADQPCPPVAMVAKASPDTVPSNIRTIQKYAGCENV